MRLGALSWKKYNTPGQHEKVKVSTIPWKPITRPGVLRRQAEIQKNGKEIRLGNLRRQSKLSIATLVTRYH